MYINIQQIFNSIEVYAHKLYFSNNFKGATSEYKGVLHCEGYDQENFLDGIIEAPLSEPFFTKRMKIFSRPDGFMLFAKLGFDFFSTCELLYPKMKSWLRLVRARPNFYMISDNPNVSLGIVDCSLYTRRIALKNDYHKNEMDMLAYSLVDLNYLKTLAKNSLHSCQRKPVNSRKPFQHSSPLDCYYSEFKLCLHWIVHQKSFLVPTNWSQKNKNTQRRSANRKFCCCWW